MGESWENLRALILPEAMQGVSICAAEVWQLCGELIGGYTSPTSLCRMNLLCSFKPAVLFSCRNVSWSLMIQASFLSLVSVNFNCLELNTKMEWFCDTVMNRVTGLSLFLHSQSDGIWNKHK